MLVTKTLPQIKISQYHGLFCLALVCFLTCQGCTLFGGRFDKPDKILVNSVPAGAEVLLNNNAAGITPVKVQLPRSQISHTIKIIREGYKSEELVLVPEARQVNFQHKKVLLNSAIFFGLIGLVEGVASGIPVKGFLGGSFLGLLVGQLQKKDELTTRYEYSPESISINLTPFLGK